MNRPTLLCLLTALLCLFNLPAHAHDVDCDADHVTLSAGIIQVTANGSDDTANLQCAIDEAKRIAIPVIELAKEEFFIAVLLFDDFDGVMTGRNREDTVVNVMDGSIDCEAMLDAGLTPSAFKFINGNAKLAKMTIRARTPCAPGFDNAFYLIHVTGEGAFEDCANDTGFGLVDRVDLVGGVPEDDSVLRAIGAFGEGLYFDTCKIGQLGTMKVNRSTIQGFDMSVALGLRASAQVDVNFNEFNGNRLDVFVFNAGQLLTVQANTFRNPTNDGGSYYGVFALTNQSIAPENNRVAVARNEFILRENANPGGSMVTGVRASQNGFFSQYDMSMVGNTFNLVGDNVEGAAIDDIGGGRVAGNMLFGDAFRGLFFSGNDLLLSGWAVVNNDFNGLNTFPEAPLADDAPLDHEDMDRDSDCVLGEGTFENIWGPSQNGWVIDQGSSNFVLESQGGFEAPRSARAKPNRAGFRSTTLSYHDREDLDSIAFRLSAPTRR